MSVKLIEYVNKKFMAKFARYEPALHDHTAMQQLKDCDRKYFYRIVLGRALPKEPYQVVLDFGQAIHTFFQIIHSTNGDVQAAFKAAMAYPLAVPEPNTPAYKYAYYNTERLGRTIAAAYDWYEKEKEQKKIKTLSIEEPINVQMPDGTFVSGRPDRVVEWGGQIWDLDYKTTSKEQKYFESERDPNDQATRYIYMLSKLHGRTIGGIIYTVIYNIAEPEKPKSGKNYGPLIYNTTISKTPKQLEVFEREQIQINRQLASNREHDIWPMKEGYQCKFCAYKWVCRQSTEAAQMAKLEADFVLKPWDHLNVNQEILSDI